MVLIDLKLQALKESYVPMKPRKGTIVMANIILDTMLEVGF